MHVRLKARSRAFLAACLLATTAIPFNSATAQQAPGATTLPEISVDAARGTDLKDMDISTTVISHEQIQAAPETSVDQILNKIPGIFIPAEPTYQLHPTGQVLNMRGFGTSTNGLVLVLLDGVPINDAYFRTVDWSQIPKDTIERIEVIRGGGATSLWGNMAMGGVINIVTREPKNGERRVTASYGSFNTEAGSAGIGFAVNPDITVGLNYDGQKSDGYNRTPAQYRNPATGPTGSTINTFNGSIYYTPNQQSKYFVKFLASQVGENGLNYNIDNNTWTNYRISFGGKTDLTAKTSMNVAGWYTASGMNTTNASNSAYSLATPTAGTPYVSQRENAKYNTFGSSAYLQSEHGYLHDVKVGADYRTTTVNDPLNIFSSTAYNGTITAQGTHQFEGVFGQGTLRLGTLPVDITLGLRQDFWQANSASITGIYSGSAINNQLNDVSATHFDPRLGAKWQITDEFALRSAIYENFSAPGMNQMYRSFISGSNYTIPNTGLVPQINQGREAGIDFRKGPVEASFTVYRNVLNNYIDYTTVQTGCAAGNNYCGTGVTSATALKQYVNAGNANLQGYELSGSWRVLDSLTLRGGFTRTNAWLTTSLYPSASVDPINMQLGQVPEWIATFGGTWTPTSKITITAVLKAFPQFWNNTSHLQVNDGAATVDVSASYKFNEHFEAFVIAQNIGNVTYYDQGLTYTSAANTTVSPTSAAPALAIPFTLTGGIKGTF